MKRHPKGHTLEVALACIKAGSSSRNPALIADLEKIAAEYKGRDRILDRHEDAKRIVVQRELFAALPSFGPGGCAADDLKKAMIDRAWALLDCGQCEACDALLEFLPEGDARAMLDDYFKPAPPSATSGEKDEDRRR